jgi:hypothetical protein
MYGVWGQDNVILWLWQSHLWDAGKHNWLSCGDAQCYLGESDEMDCAVAAWQEGTGLNMSLA